MLSGFNVRDSSLVRKKGQMGTADSSARSVSASSSTSKGKGQNGHSSVRPQPTGTQPNSASGTRVKSSGSTTNPKGHKPKSASISTTNSQLLPDDGLGSVSAGVHCAREEDETASLKLTQNQVKRLKVAARKYNGNEGVPLDKLNKFIDLGNMSLMMLDIKATLLHTSVVNEENAAQEAKALILTRDFQAPLKTRLFACLLSPNITAYVTDTVNQIMEFIQAHAELFKVMKIMIEDPEVNRVLKKLVSRLLSTVRGQFRTTLIKSISRRSSIMDVVVSLSRMAGNIDVNASHWARFAFIRNLLRVFLLATANYNDLTAGELYTPTLKEFMHPTVHAIIVARLGITADSHKGAEDDDPDADLDAEADDDADAEGVPDEDYVNHDNHDEDGVPNDGLGSNEDLSVDNDADDIADDLDNDSEQQGDGSNADNSEEVDDNLESWARKSKDFWKYVDGVLINVRKASQERSNGTHDKYKAQYASYFVNYLQKDLRDFPGKRKVINTNLQEMIASPDASTTWQSVIQTELIWG